MKLSILIPSIPRRKKKLQRLLKELESQKSNDIEILVDSSKSYRDGGLTVGSKRDSLLRRAKGEYICYLDDDEKVSPDYIETLLRLCSSGADVCTFNAFVKLFNAWGVVRMSLENKVNEEFTPDRIVNRPAWHMCPVKRDIAVLEKFKDINNAEDFDWMGRVLERCKTEIHTDRIVYQYNHGKDSEVDKIENNE